MAKIKNILCVIPARRVSSYKDKHFIRIGGKSVIEHVIQAALQARYINDTAISSDDERLVKLTKKFKIHFIKRPSYLAKNLSPIEEALRHCVRKLEEIGKDYNAVCLLQANVILREKDAIDRCIQLFYDKKPDSVVTVKRVSQFPEWMYVIKNGYLHNKYSKNKRSIPYRRQSLEAHYMLDGAIQVIGKNILMSNKGKRGLHIYLGRRIIPLVQNEFTNIEIDEEFDVILAESILKYLKKVSKKYI